MKLSVIIITRNEAHNIGDCLASVAFADEWIIVDSGSTDGTVAIAKAAGATVIETADWPGFGPQKSRALAAASGDWILSLDADERIPAALRDEILAIIGSASTSGATTAPGTTRSLHAAYEMPRLSSFCGRFIRHGGWYPDHVVRLFQRGAAGFTDHLVHERIIVAPGGSTGRLRTPMLHYSYRDDDDVLRKQQQYASLGAQQAFAAGKRSSFGGALGHALAAFLRSYVFKRGFLDGAAGLMVALAAAETTYHKYFKLMLLSEQDRDK